MSKFKSPAVDGVDLADAMAAFTKDLLLEVRQQIIPHYPGELIIITEAYRHIEGVKIGVAHDRVVWTAGGLPLPAKMLAGLHRVYWQASDLAHAAKTGPYKGGKG